MTTSKNEIRITKAAIAPRHPRQLEQPQPRLRDAANALTGLAAHALASMTRGR